MLVLVLACSGGEGPCSDTVEADCERDDDCAWRVPGCVAEELMIEEGCYPVEPCVIDGCEEGFACESKSYDPCAGEDCGACGAQTQVCVAE